MEVRVLLALAAAEARNLGHAYLGPEHLLISIAGGDGAAARSLAGHGVTARGVRCDVRRIVGAGGTVPDGEIPQAPRTRHVLRQAARLARSEAAVTPEFVLAAIALEREAIAARILQDAGVDGDGLAAEVLKAVDRERRDWQTVIETFHAQTREEQRDRAREQESEQIAVRVIDLEDGLTAPGREVLAALGDGTRLRRSRTIVRRDPRLYAHLVRMAQPWLTRYPLVDGRGNFGSRSGFGPADMEYTEARRTPFAADAGLVPLVLVNGGPGIPPHNLREVAAAAAGLVRDRGAALELPGPDFPSGGVLVRSGTLADVYRTGRGALTLRGRVQREPGERPRLIVTETAYGTHPQGLIRQIVDQIHDRFAEVTDLTDQSDAEGMRVVIELRRGAEVDAVLARLYAGTDLEVTVPVDLRACVGGVPRGLNLRELLAEWIASRRAAGLGDAEILSGLAAAAERHGDARRTELA